MYISPPVTCSQSQYHILQFYYSSIYLYGPITSSASYAEEQITTATSSVSRSCGCQSAGLGWAGIQPVHLDQLCSIPRFSFFLDQQVPGGIGFSQPRQNCGRDKWKHTVSFKASAQNLFTVTSAHSPLAKHNISEAEMRALFLVVATAKPRGRGRDEESRK